MASSVEMEKEITTQEESFSLELPAPPGWNKKFTPKKSGTPGKSKITFMSPTGEGITNRRQLEQYLKAHPGGPTASEFDWGTGETPRRSARFSEKAKATPQEIEPPKKRSRKSSASRKENKKTDTDPEGTENKETGTAPEGTEKKVQEIHMQEAEKPEKNDAVDKDVIKESQDEIKHKAEYTDSKTEAAATEEAKGAQDINIPTRTGEAEKVQEKYEQPQVEDAKEHGPGGQANAKTDEEKNYQPREDDKEKLNVSVPVSDHTGLYKMKDKVEADAVENCDHGGDANEVKS